MYTLTIIFSTGDTYILIDNSENLVRSQLVSDFFSINYQAVSYSKQIDEYTKVIINHYRYKIIDRVMNQLKDMTKFRNKADQVEGLLMLFICYLLNIKVTRKK